MAGVDEGTQVPVGEGQQQGVVVAATGPIRQDLATRCPELRLPSEFVGAAVPLPGVLMVAGPAWSKGGARVLAQALGADTAFQGQQTPWPLVVLVEDKHWGCDGSLMIDARIKPHHAPRLVEDPAVTARVDQLFAKGGALHGVI